MRWFAGFVAAAGLLAASNAPALAQKAQDTLRIATAGQTATTVSAESPMPETDLVAEAVYDALLCYDVAKGEFHPLLAKSWKQVDPRTLEFTLRDDAKWQDGSPVTADDVAYTFNYYRDPANKLGPFTHNHATIAGAVALDARTARLTLTQPDATELLNIAVLGDILPSKLHGATTPRADFGRLHPIGTGPYKVSAIDNAGNVTLVRNPYYPQASPCKPAAQIGTIRLFRIPDEQTRVAQLLTGGVDLIPASGKDQVQLMAQDPRFVATGVSGTTFAWMPLDTLNRSGKAEPLTKPEVRQAIAMSFDRLAVARAVLAGGDAIGPVDAPCAPFARGCVETVKPYAYDPLQAKALLAKAGYPDGFDITLSTYQLFGMSTLAQAIAGEMRKVGIRASVNVEPNTAYTQEFLFGKTAMGVAVWGPTPDVDSDFTRLFPGGDHDYWADSDLLPLIAQARAATDQPARDALYRQIFDRVNREALAIPIATIPGIFIHTSDVAVPTAANNRYGIDLSSLAWK